MKKLNPLLLLAGGAVLAHFTTRGNGIFGIGTIKESIYIFVYMDKNNNEIKRVEFPVYSYKEAMKIRTNILGNSLINDLYKIKLIKK